MSGATRSSGIDTINSVGVFDSNASGIPDIAFGPGGPTLADILSGTYNDPTYGIISPIGSYKITDEPDEAGKINNVSFDNFEEINFAVTCFTRGTQIATIKGAVNIEDLEVGDKVQTLDHGYQPIRWIGKTTVPARGKLAPVLIRKGTLGNQRDLRVSPQHRMLMSGWQVELLASEHEALAPAINLVNGTTVVQEEGETVEYWHVLFDTHEIVYAEGIPSESFHPGELGIGSMAEATREEIYTLFPELREDVAAYGPSARATLKGFEAKIVIEQMGV